MNRTIPFIIFTGQGDETVVIEAGVTTNRLITYMIRREGTKAWPNGPDLRSGFEGIQGFKSLPSHWSIMFKSFFSLSIK